MHFITSQQLSAHQMIVIETPRISIFRNLVSLQNGCNEVHTNPIETRLLLIEHIFSRNFAARAVYFLQMCNFMIIPVMLGPAVLIFLFAKHGVAQKNVWTT
jgi:hypothetical protein